MSLPYFTCLKYTKPEERDKHCESMFSEIKKEQDNCKV